MTMRDDDTVDAELAGMQLAIVAAMRDHYIALGRKTADRAEMVSVLLVTAVAIGRQFLDETGMLAAMQNALGQQCEGRMQ